MNIGFLFGIFVVHLRRWKVEGKFVVSGQRHMK